MDYLTELGLSNEEISNINPALVESLTLFPLVVKENFSTVRELKLTNEHDVFVKEFDIASTGVEAGLKSANSPIEYIQ